MGRAQKIEDFFDDAPSPAEDEEIQEEQTQEDTHIRRRKESTLIPSPTQLNLFLAWIGTLDPKDPRYRDQKILITIVKKEHNQALVRHVFDLFAIFQAEQS